MSKLNFIKPRRIAVVPLDRRVQITYKHHTVEYPCDSFVLRVVADFDGCSMFIRRTFKEMFSSPFLLLGRLDVYVTLSLFTTPTETRDMEDIFRMCRCVKNVHKVYCPTAITVGMGLPDNTDSVIFDLDKESCYIYVYKNGKIEIFEEIYAANEDRIIRYMKFFDLPRRCSDIFQYQDYDVYLVGSNDNIMQIHSVLQKLMNREIILLESNTVISEGLDMIMSQKKLPSIVF